MANRKSASKSSSKTTGKPTASKPAASKRQTLATLRAHVDDITGRLQQADALTRKNVKSLQTAFSAMETQVKEHQTVNHAALTRRVDQLTSQLTQSIAATKKDIASDLKQAMDNPTLTSIEAAIGRSELRLARTEENQATAFSKVNRHIAELARIIDARFKAVEVKADSHNELMATLETQITSSQSQSYERIRLVEDTTANAVRQLGTDLVNTAEKFQHKLDRHSEVMREKLSDIAKQTQRDVGIQNSAISQRLDRVESGQQDQADQLERALTKLTARIDSLEYGLTHMPEAQAMPSSAFAAPIQPPMPAISADDGLDVFASTDNAMSSAEIDPFAPMPQPEVQAPSVPSLSLVPSEPAYNPYSDEPPLEQAYQEQSAESLFTEQHSTEVQAQPFEYQPETPIAETTFQQHHYVDPTAQMAQITPPAHDGNTAVAYDPYSDPNTASESQPVTSYSPQPIDGPVEYKPQEYIPPVQTSPNLTPQAPTQIQQQPSQQNLVAPEMSIAPQQFTPDELPYADPGYGETPTEDGVSRPGHVEGLKARRKSKKAKLKGSSALSSLPITPRNLRVAGLAIILAFAGYFGIKNFMGSGDAITPPVNQIVEPQPTERPTGLPDQPVLIAEPIGDYQDNQVATVQSQTTPAQNSSDGVPTLQNAADDGNAIAQFQLGVTYLDAGRSKEGLKYVRASANQGQPAAQYRLAKLYEAGVGVASDPDMARQLTERAARAGNRIAMHDLGLYYAEGRGGVERNMDTALSWFEKAAERGVVDSQYNLGVLFESSPEVPRNPVSSFVWYSIASGQGDQLAANRVEILKSELSADDLTQAERRVSQFKPASIDEAANGIFRQVPWIMPQSNSIAPSAELVRDAQSLLGQLGYKVGTPDGDAGPKTQNAVKAFERANGLPESGIISSSLVDRLEAAAGV